MSSQNQLSVCNLALLSIGARAQVSSILPSDGSTAGDACSQLYQFVFEALARSARWNCLRKQVALSLLTANAGTPENPLGTSLPVTSQQPWLYAYAVPSDSLAIRFLIPTNNSSGSGSSIVSPAYVSAASYFPRNKQIPYAVAYSVDVYNNPIQVILTNLTQAQCVYTVNQPNPAIWDSQFTAAFVASMGVYLVPALAGSVPMGKMAMETAERLIGEARAADGNESVVSQNRESDWISARTGSSLNYGYGCNLSECSEMPWPAFG
jgi:hypothetical protein